MWAVKLFSAIMIFIKYRFFMLEFARDNIEQVF
jgi:hypothetical protein